MVIYIFYDHCSAGTLLKQEEVPFVNESPWDKLLFLLQADRGAGSSLTH